MWKYSLIDIPIALHYFTRIADVIRRFNIRNNVKENLFQQLVIHKVLAESINNHGFLNVILSECRSDVFPGAPILSLIITFLNHGRNYSRSNYSSLYLIIPWPVIILNHCLSFEPLTKNLWLVLRFSDQSHVTIRS